MIYILGIELQHAVWNKMDDLQECEKFFYPFLLGNLIAYEYVKDLKLVKITTDIYNDMIIKYIYLDIHYP